MAEKKEKTSKVPTGELGYPGLEQYAGLVQETWITDLNSSSKQVKVYDEMYRYDPTASTMIKTTSMFMCSAEPRVKPASNSAADIEAAEFLESCFSDMTKSWQEVMSDIVLHIVYGYFPMEIVYWKRDGVKSKSDDNRVGWRKWAPRHPVTLDHWLFDDNGGLLGIVQMGPPDYKLVTIPIEKMLHFTTTSMGKNNPKGVSVLEGAYTSWFYAKNLTIQEAIIIERMGGTPYIKMPENSDDSDTADSDLSKAKRVVRNVKTAEDMGLTLPFGFEFDYATPQRGPAIEPGEVIMRHRRDMARALMMDFIMLGGGDQGSWAMHKDKSQLYIRSLNTFLRRIADVINRHAIPRLFSLNAFPGITGLPEVYFTPITKIDIGDFAEVIAKLFNSGAVTYDLETENMVRRETGLPEITEVGKMYRQPINIDSADDYSPGNQAVGGPQDDEEEETEEPETDEEGQDEKEEEMAEFSENGRLSHSGAVTLADQVGNSMMREYDKISRNLAQALSETEDEGAWEGEVDAALFALSIAMTTKLRGGMFRAWDSATGKDTSIEGLRAILAELEFQRGYIDGSLNPAIKERILNERRKLKENSASKSIIALALLGALASFRYRVKQYEGGVYKLWANFAAPTAMMKRMLPVAKRKKVVLERDWGTGAIRGDGIKVRYVGINDENTCDDCRTIIADGWRTSVPPIGSNKCGSNDRCRIEYKFYGKIYR